MIAKDSREETATAESAAPPPPSSRKFLIAVQLLITAALLALGIWYIASRVSLRAVTDAIANAHLGYLLLAIAVMVFTIALKVWRWQFLFTPLPIASPSATSEISPQSPLSVPPSLPRSRVVAEYSPTNAAPPPFWSLFWATCLGQYMNLLIPFLRLGDVARIYALRQQAGISSMRSVGTLVVEKALDLIFFALTVVVLLPFVVLPDFYRPGLLLALVPALLLAVLFFLAYRPQAFVQLARQIIGRFPAKWEARLSRGLIAGLEGIAALRSRRITLLLLATSLIVAILSALLPYILFLAFSLPLSLVDGALMHVVVSVASAPPTTPARIGVFNGVAALLLLQLGIQDEAVVVGYAIIFHLVVIVPQIILGSIASWQTDWDWRRSLRKWS